MRRGRKWLAIATRVFAICPLIVFSMQMFGAVMAAPHSSISANVCGQTSMIWAGSSENRRGNLSSELELRDFVIPHAQIFRQTTNMDVRASNRFTRFDLAQHTTLGNRLGSGTSASAQPEFAHEDSEDADFAARIHRHIQLNDCAMNGADTQVSNKLLLARRVLVCKFNANDSIKAGPTAQLSIPTATAIHSDNSHDHVILDRRERKGTMTLFLKQNTPEWQATRISK
jgi:hypothetical protein